MKKSMMIGLMLISIFLIMPLASASIFDWLTGKATEGKPDLVISGASISHEDYSWYPSSLGKYNFANIADYFIGDKVIFEVIVRNQGTASADVSRVKYIISPAQIQGVDQNTAKFLYQNYGGGSFPVPQEAEIKTLGPNEQAVWHDYFTINSNTFTIEVEADSENEIDEENENNNFKEDKYQISTVRGCYDSDGGLNPSLKGDILRTDDVHKELTKFTSDNCNNATSLNECYCIEGNHQCSIVTCEKGCENSKCLGEPEVEPKPEYTCTDSDGGIDYFVRGTCYDEVYTGGLTDTCNGMYGIEEFECVQVIDPIALKLHPSGLMCQASLEKGTNVCPNRCELGACIKEAKNCTDSDGGKDYYSNGMVVGLESPGSTNTRIDIDYCGISGDEWGKLVEYICEGDYGKKIIFDCPEGCENGACVGEPKEEECVYGLKYDIEDYKQTKFSKEESYPGFDIIKNPTKAASVYKTWYLMDNIYFYAIVVSFNSPTERDAEFEKVKGTLDGDFITYSPSGLLEYWNPSSYNPLKDQIVYWGEEDDGMLMAWTNDIESAYYGKCGNRILIVGSEHSFELLPDKEMPEEEMTNFLLDVYNPLVDAYLKQYPALFEEASVIEIEEGGECNGCILENNCYPFGYRKSGKYCSSNKEFVVHLEENSVCENSFECESNVCAGGECIGMNFIQKIISWFKSLFGM